MKAVIITGTSRGLGAAFKQLEDFVNFKKEGILRSPAFVAEKLADMLFIDHFPKSAAIIPAE